MDMPVAYSYFEAMYTRMEMIFPDLAENIALDLVRNIFNETVRLDTKLNRFNELSIVSELNNRTTNIPIEVDDEMFYILQQCSYFYQITKGFFDITIQSKVELPFSSTRYLLDEKTKTVTFVHPKIQIDLGGFAKGYALQKIENLLKEYSVKNCVVNFGNSSVITVGHHPFGDSWNIGIEHPMHKNESLEIIALKDNALSVSGNIPKKPKHIISPATHKYINGVKMIVVIGSSPLISEILSTALFAAPSNVKGQILLNFPEYRMKQLMYQEQGKTIVYS